MALEPRPVRDFAAAINRFIAFLILYLKRIVFFIGMVESDLNDRSTCDIFQRFPSSGVEEASTG